MTNLAGSRPQQLEEKPTKFVPGQPDMWMFVLFESLLFTGYFSVYLVSRTQSEELYLRSQAALDLRIGVFNTIALLLSSWAIARCVKASREGAYRSALINASLTILFGVVFLVSKVLEWVKEIPPGEYLHQQRILSTLFLPDLNPLHTRVDRLHRAGRCRLPAVEPGPALPAACRNVRDVLAHRRLPLGSDLCVALRREVICEHHFQ